MLAASFAQFVDPNPAPGNQFGNTVVPLSTGNVVVTSPYDDFGGIDAGAVYLFNGATGALLSTLRGATDNDRIGLNGVTALTNGNYVVISSQWDNSGAINAGAVTWGSGTTGIKGIITAANSLVGSSQSDFLGSFGVTALTNGNYVVASASWDNGVATDAGAVTWGNGAVGIKGIVGTFNSLIGSTASDFVGTSGVTALTNGNYVVSSPNWDNGSQPEAGAVTWGDGRIGVKGIVSVANSLVGGTAIDMVGNVSVTALTNGNYVVNSPNWDNGSTQDVGAATWGSGTTGVRGVLSADNSLVGNTTGDFVGTTPATALTNGNYVVSSANWDNGSTPNVGAVTWGSGTTGVQGVVSVDNSLVGSTPDDFVGGASVTALTNGNYVVNSPSWNNGAAADAGAATWGNGATGIRGVVSTDNSLVGSTAGDAIAINPATALSNGHYVVSSPNWGNGGTFNLGAATWGNGTAGTQGIVSISNSLVGSTQDDNVGSIVTALTNGNYVVSSPFWNGSVANVGAVTWGGGATGIQGVVSTGNSLIGSVFNDAVGIAGATALTNGNYVVGSPAWNNGAFPRVGAVTWGSGATGIQGVVGDANSLVGSSIGNDFVGLEASVVALPNGNYVVSSSSLSYGAAIDVGAATWGNGAVGTSGPITSQNSALGGAANSGLQGIVVDSVNRTFFARFLTEGGGTVRVGSQFNGFQPAPVIDNFGEAISYTENAAPRRLSTTATIEDIDSADFGGGQLVVKIIGGSAEDRLTILTAGGISTNSESKVLFAGQIIGSFRGGVGTTQLVVNFNPSATPDKVQQLLRQIAYSNVSDNPRSEVRTARVFLNDGDGGISDPVAKQIRVTRVNDAPLLAPATGGTAGYINGGPVIGLLDTATVTDPDSTDFAGGRLLVRTIVGAHASNRLLIGAGFTIVGDAVQRSGVTIGTRNADGGIGTTRLEITFNANATTAIVEQLVRAIRFRTVGGNSTTQRLIEFSLTDGDGGLSNTATKRVNVTNPQ